ncbi:MAG: peptidylprolyl isomerase [Myxococcaceae bacterium]
MRVRYWVLLALAFTACPKREPDAAPAAPKEPEELAKIADAEDRRALADGLLVNLAANHADPKVRVRAYTALGRIQEPTTLDAVVKGLTDKVPAVRAEAAWASGMIAFAWQGLPDADKLKLSDALRAAEDHEDDAAAHDQMLEALGRVATPGAVDRLNERLIVTALQARVAQSLGVAFRHGAKFPIASARMLTALLSPELPDATRFGAAYAFAASKELAGRAPLRSCLTDGSAEVRAICAKGLGDVGEDVDAVALKARVDDPDYRVAVEAVRSLAKLSQKCKALVCPPLGALADLSSRTDRLLRGDAVGGGQVLLALAQQGVPTVGVPVLVRIHEQLKQGMATQSDKQVKHDIANLECRFAAAIDRAEGELNLGPQCGGGVISDPQRFSLMLTELAESAPKTPKKRYEQVAPYLDNPDPKVKWAAIQALASSKYPAAADKLRVFLSGQDLVLAGAAANALAKLGDQQSIPQVRALALKCLTNLDPAGDVAEALKTFKNKESVVELNQWLQSPQAFLRHSAADVIQALSGKPVAVPPVEAPAEPKKGSMPKDATLTLKTVRGEIVLKFLTADAPRTTASMYTLARKGFFKNTIFHRIVPDFVAQGGDPRGDGNGGPGYAIRCEVSHHPYNRGAVGMALSGKDTGGSQFFLTLAPQPHLEGRYTVWAEITKGQEVADALLEGDQILDARADP